jgi:hypothetical protein
MSSTSLPHRWQEAQWEEQRVVVAVVAPVVTVVVAVASVGHQ